MRFSRLAAIAGASVLVLGLVACSSTGGKPEETGGGMGAGQANTPRVTIAMITHEVPGDSFWDLIRKGAAGRRGQGQHRAAVLQRPGGAEPGATSCRTPSTAASRASPSRWPSPTPMAPAVKAALAKGIPVVAFNSGFDDWKAMGVQEYFGQDEKLAGEAAGERLQQGRRQEGPLRDPGAGPGRARSPLRRRQGRASRGSPRSSTSTARTCRRWSRRSPPSCSRTQSIDHVVTLGAPIALTAVQSVEQRGQLRQGRHLRHQRRAGRRDQGRRRAVGRRPAAVPAGLSGDRLAVALHQQQERDRRRSAHADRPVVHRQVQHRRRRRVGQGRNPLSPARRRVKHDYTSRSRPRQSQGRPRRTGQRTKQAAAPADPPRDGRADRRGRDLHLLHDHRPAVPQPRGAGHRAVRQLDDRDHGVRGRAADDRRRVRPVGRRRGHHEFTRRVDAGLQPASEPVGRCGLGADPSRWRSASSTATW